jgi:hypothetical protein
MDGVGRLSGTQYRRLAARWRRLAEDATTPQTREHLLALARQCEFLAGKPEIAARQIAEDEQDGAGFRSSPR